jgi:hypothetical protein
VAIAVGFIAIRECDNCKRRKSPPISQTLLSRGACAFWRWSSAGAGKMSEKLGIGDTFPKLTLNLVDGGRLDLPDGVDAKYRIFLFYRGHW